jgi:vancomycin resistance protein YoaR
MLMYHILIPSYRNDDIFLIETKLILKVKDDTLKCSLSEFQLSYDKELYYKKIALLEYSNQLYEDINQEGLFFVPELQLEAKEVTIPATINEDKLTNYLKKNLKGYNQQVKNAMVAVRGDKFTYEDELYGQSVVINKIIEDVNHSLDDWNLKDIIIQVEIATIEPGITSNKLKESTDILGEYGTKFASNIERENNLLNGMDFIHGYVLKPGDIFSSQTVLGPFTKENGYEISNAFSEGDLVQSVGGGVCQLTTTLYNAVLYAELEITERYEHSMQVSYVDASRDATVTSKYKDFKFKNNTNGNIIITGKVLKGEISFVLYGKDERDKKNRRIDFQVFKKRYITPEKVEIVMDKSIKGINEYIERKSRFGCEAELYKIVYNKDVEVERILINTSKYAPLTSLVKIGYD